MGSRRVRLVGGGALVAAGSVALALAAPTAASAHVTAAASSTAAGSYTVVTFSLAHGCEGSPTTGLSITIPEGINSVSPTVNPNWDVVKNEVAIADPVKASTPDALKALAAEGIKVIMLTGDVRTTANAIARQLGIADVEAEVLPDHKSAVVVKLQKAGKIVAMAGDGVNDAPALAAADVGVAMGTGTDVAIESADVTLLGGDLAALVKARDLSVDTMRNIRQNLVFAFVYNVVGIPLAALGLLSPIFAGAAMAFSSVSVVSNALLLRRWRPAVDAKAPGGGAPVVTTRPVNA